MSGGGPEPTKPSSEWKYNPIYVCAHPEVRTKDYPPGESLPLGKSIDFETDLFVGKCLLRFIGIPGDNPKDDEAYFEGKKRKWQMLVQGRFKEEISMGELLVGDFYEKPMLNIPKGSVMKVYQRFMEFLTPGIIMDMISDKPKILSNFGTMQTLRVDLPGNEPDITILDSVQEDSSLLITDKKDLTMAKRRKYLGKLKNSCKYTTNPNHVYTFELFDHTINFGTYHQSMGTFQIDLVKSMNDQALALCLFTRDQRVLYKFVIWNERTFEAKKEKEQEEQQS
mmetsp:Transcript_1550/g.2376  ORF Transcript_1550/g.2376 Transcript_1550/m.2376 type:complete len:281 (+) Transcript_1550:196-1038(+)